MVVLVFGIVIGSIAVLLYTGFRWVQPLKSRVFHLQSRNIQLERLTDEQTEVIRNYQSAVDSQIDQIVALRQKA